MKNSDIKVIEQNVPDKERKEELIKLLNEYLNKYWYQIINKK